MPKRWLVNEEEKPDPAQVDIPVEAAEAAEKERLRGEEQAQVRRIADLRQACAEHASKRYTAIRRMRRLYYDQWDFTSKAAWQSKVWLPVAFDTVEKLISLYSAGLIPNERWFTVEDTWQRSAGRERALESILGRLLEQSGFYELLRLILQEGLIGGTAPVVIGVDSRGKVPEPSMTLWDPLDVAVDWSGRQRFLVLRSVVDGYTLEQWAEQGLYEGDRIKEALETARPVSETVAESPWDSRSNTYVLDQWWGDLADGEGKLLIGNGTCTVVNERVMIRPLIENPWQHGGPPVVMARPLRAAYRVWSPGLLEHLSGSMRMLTELACLLLDSAFFSAVPAWQADARISNADLQRGVYPGKVFRVPELLGKGGGLAAVNLGEYRGDVLTAIQMLQRQVQESSGATEYTTGNPAMAGTKGPGTATQFRGMQQSALGLVKSIARDIETHFLAPLLEMVLSVFAQVTAGSPKAWTNTGLRDILGPQALLLLMALGEEERWESLTRGVRYKPRGVTGSLGMAEDAQRLLAWAGVMKGDPEMWGMVKKRRLAEKLVELHKQSPDDLLWSEEELQQQAMQAQQAQAALGSPAGMPPGMGPGGPPGMPAMPPGMMPQPPGVM